MSIQDDPAYLVCQIAPGGLSDQSLRAQRERGV
jgi:hypothetical protein